MHDEVGLIQSTEEVGEQRGFAAAEPMEGWGGTKGNADLQSTVRTQSRKAVSQAQARGSQARYGLSVTDHWRAERRSDLPMHVRELQWIEPVTVDHAPCKLRVPSRSP
jgi:hypothetical protein